MSIRVQIFTVADAATVREGLLSVLGAGIGTVRRSSFPAPLQATVAILLSDVPGDQAHSITVRLNRTDPGEEDLIAEVTADVEPGIEVKGPADLPFVIDSQDLGIPEPGSYRFTLIVDGDELHHQNLLAIVHENATPGFD